MNTNRKRSGKGLSLSSADQKNFTRQLILESIGKIAGNLQSFLGVSVSVFDSEGHLKLNVPETEESVSEKLPLTDFQSENREFVFVEEQEYAVFPIWFGDEAAARIRLKPVTEENRKFVESGARFAKSLIREIVNKNKDFVDAVINYYRYQDELSILYDFFEKISGLDDSIKDIELHTVNKIIKLVVNQLNCEFAFVLHYDENKESLKVIASHPKDLDAEINAQILKDRSVYETYFKPEKTIICNDLSDVDLSESCLSGMQIQNMLVAPLKSVGWLVLFNKQEATGEKEDFYNPDKEFVSVLTRPTGYFLGNIRNAKKMAEEEAWREVSFRAAHKMGNSLFGLRGEIDWLKIVLEEEPFDKEEMASSIERTLTSFMRTKQIIDEFKDFYKSAEIEPESVNIGDILEEIRFYVKKSMKDDIRIEMDVEPNLPEISLDRSKFRQATMELLENAALSMNGAGQIFIRAKESDEMKKKNGGVSTSQKYITITIRDTGAGIPPENKKKIFHPFFSTTSRGSGLGLSIVRKYIQLHGGDIKEVGQFGKGAEFRILLPIN